MDQLPRLGKRKLICLLLFTCNYVLKREEALLCHEKSFYRGLRSGKAQYGLASWRLDISDIET